MQKSSDQRFASATFTALVRSESQVTTLGEHGVHAILFSGLDDTTLLTKVASEHDIVINSASAFNVEAAKALIDGLASRQKETGQKAIYIHTSGTSSIGDRPLTKIYREDRVFSDKEAIHAYQLKREAQLPYAQRTTDVAVVKAGVAVGVKTYIIMSPTIYGRGTGPFNQLSIQIPTIIKRALLSGQTPVLGTGSEGWDHVHIADLADLYELLLTKLLAGEDLPNGEQGIYFSENGHHTWRSVSEGVAKAGVKLGALKTADVKELSLEEWGAGSSSAVMPANLQTTELGFASRARGVSDIAKRLGWKPRYGDKEWEENFEDDFRAVLEQQQK